MQVRGSGPNLVHDLASTPSHGAPHNFREGKTNWKPPESVGLGGSFAWKRLPPPLQAYGARIKRSLWGWGSNR
jgi:hypothetical protein